MDLELSGTYSFSVYPVAVLGTNFKNVTINAIINANIAQQLGFDVYGQHALISPTLPSTTQITDPTKYTYLQLLLPTGLTQIIAYEWINPTTIQTVNLGRFTIVLDNESSSSQQKILNMLAANGYTVSSIDFESVQSSA